MNKNSSILEKTSRYCVPTLGSLGFQKETLYCAENEPVVTTLNWEHKAEMKTENNKGILKTRQNLNAENIKCEWTITKQKASEIKGCRNKKMQAKHQ